MATARSVLVVTAASEFGALIQAMLEETGLYKVMVVDSDQEALLCIQTVAFTVAILDAELPGGSMLTLATAMRHKLPKMRQVIICADDHPALPAVNAFHPDGLLSKPFFLPDLLDTLTKALQSPIAPAKSTGVNANKPPKSVSIPASPPAPEWLHDASWAARNLTQLSLETSAQAALIVRDGLLWAYAGELPQLAAIELVDIINSAWEADSEVPTHVSNPRGQKDDLVRFVNLDSTQGEYMLYATLLGKGMVLSLAFETETPFSTIRAQAGYLARALASPPGSPLPPLPKAAMLSSVQAGVNAITGSDVLPSHLPPLLEDVPPPAPHQDGNLSGKTTIAPTWFHEASAPTSISEIPAPPPARSNPAPASELKLTNPPEGFADRLMAPLAPPPPDNEKSITPSDLLPASSTLHYLTCSCTLLPRLPQHQLGRELVQLLRDWVPQLCVSFGWQLLHINISSEYITVIARVAPNTAPGSFVRILRQQTSRRIFTALPHLAVDNPAREFWAPGYLILSSSQPPPVHIIRHFIEQTRLQQGISKNGQ